MTGGHIAIDSSGAVATNSASSSSAALSKTYSALGKNFKQIDSATLSKSLETLPRQLLLRLYSARIVSSIINTLAIILITISIILLALFVRNWLQTSAETEELLSSMRSASLAIPESASIIEERLLTPDERTNILERNLFNTRSVAKAPEKSSDEEKPAPRINTDFELLGTFYSARNSEAIIANKKTRTQEAFRQGETVFEEAELKAIYADRVELQRAGELEILYLATVGQSANAGVSASEVDETISIDGSDLEEALENLPLLLTQARAVPFFQDGQAVGLRLFAIRDGSLYQKAGLRNGDILKSVNGNSLADISKAAKLFEMLRDERSIVLDMERSRQARKVQYSIR
jgi:general secretion pathway protein C